MNAEINITISIVSHGDASKILRLLDSLQKWEPSLDHFQIILTDNLMKDLPDFDPAPWGRLTILRNNNPLGFAENHNRAFMKAQGEYFAVLNPDLIFSQTIFENLLASLQRGFADLVAPTIVDENGKMQDSFRILPTPIEIIRRRFPWYSFKSMEPDETGFIHPDWIAGMFWLMRSDFYNAMGGMDEKFRLYFEDVDFCSRARLSGKKILVDSRIQITHQAQRSSHRNLSYFLLHVQSMLKFFLSPVYWQLLRRGKLDV